MGEKTEWFGWIDLSKVIGIFLMILGHQRLLDERTTLWIFTFHMPLFFFLSGVMSKKEPFQVLLMKNLRTLLIPFFIISVIWILYYLACFLKSGSVDWNVWLEKSWKSIVFPYEGYCIYLWFLLALFWCKLMSYSFFSHGIIRWVGLLLSIILSILTIHHNLHIPFSISQAFLSYPFFFVGACLSTLIKEERRIKVWTPVSFASVVVIMFSLINGRVNIADLSFGNNVVLFLIFGTIGSIMIIGLTKLIEGFNQKLARNRVVEVLAAGTLLIVGFSAMLTGYVKSLFVSLFGESITDHSLVGFLIGLIVLMLFYPVILICLRWFPAIIGFRSRNGR